MTISREDLEEMQETLKEAFDLAKKTFDRHKHYGASDADVRHATKTLVKVSEAILRLEKSLRDMDDTPAVTKLAAPKMPGKQ